MITSVRKATTDKISAQNSVNVAVLSAAVNKKAVSLAGMSSNINSFLFHEWCQGIYLYLLYLSFYVHIHMNIQTQDILQDGDVYTCTYIYTYTYTCTCTYTYTSCPDVED